MTNDDQELSFSPSQPTSTSTNPGEGQRRLWADQLSPMNERLSPLVVFLLTLAGIGVAETIAMVVIYLLPSMRYALQTLIDLAIMLLLLLPFLYLTLLKPLIARGDRYQEATEVLQRTNAELQELQLIVDQSTAIAFEWQGDGDGSVTYISNNVRQFGYDAEEFIEDGMTYRQIIHPEDRERVMAAMMKQAAEGWPELIQQYRLRTRSDTVRWVDVRTWLSPHSPRAAPRFHGLIVDTTLHKLYEQRLERSNAELEQLRAQEESQRRWAEALVEATTVLSKSLDLDEILEHILAQIERVIPAQASVILFTDGDRISTLRHRGFPEIPQRLAGIELGNLSLDDIPRLGPALKRNQPISIGDLHERQSPWQMGGLEWLRSLILAPLQLEDKPVGLLALLSDQPHYFDEKDVEHLLAFGNQAQIALQNARLFAREHAARQQAEVLRTATLALAHSLDLVSVMRLSLEHIGRLIPFDLGHIVLLEEDGGRVLRLRRTGGEPEFSHTLEETSWSSETFPHLSRLLENKESVLFSDSSELPPWCPLADHKKPGSWLGVPLIVGDTTIGFYCLDKGVPGFFTNASLELAEAMAAQAAVAMQNAWLFEQVEAARERQKSLSRRLVEVREYERQYVSRELHDEAGQALTALLARLRRLEEGANKPDVVLECAADIEATVQMVISNLHRIASALRPVTLDQLGLKAAIQLRLEEMGTRHHIKVQLDSDGLVERLPGNVETILYRIAQEALTNVIRHANASRVDVLLKRRAEMLVLMIEDDGRGFEPTETAEQSLGLLGLKERAEMLGGELIMESAPGKGTTILVEIPYAS